MHVFLLFLLKGHVVGTGKIRRAFNLMFV